MINFTETVRNSADIVRVVSDYVSLKGAGSTLKGLCPFHSEKTPSFSVHRDKQFFYCFGCLAIVARAMQASPILLRAIALLRDLGVDSGIRGRPTEQTIEEEWN